MKRILFALLASILLLSSLTACAQGDDDPADSGNTPSDTNSESESTFFPDIAKKDYGGADFRMIGWTEAGEWYFAENYESSENKTSILNNTLYEMNTLVEEHLNVEIRYKTVAVGNGHETFNTVYPTIMSGDDTYQLCTMDAYYDNINFITKNCALDLNKLEALDFDQFY